MIRTAPKKSQIALIAVFTAVCVFLLLYLWIQFGGSTPLAAQGYRIKVAFAQANELATGADVRVAGVNVGKVIALSPDLHDNRTLATLEIDPRYVPIPRDARATLRIKTLLGETYVQLGWSSRRGGALPDGGRLPDGRVAATVAVDQILSTFDPRTRRAFRTWMQSQAGAVAGRGGDINDTLAALPGFVGSGTRLTAALQRQSSALGGLIAHTGTFFRAVSARRGELSGLISGADSLFTTTAQRNRALAALFEALPGFERESRVALPALTRFGERADPVVRALGPLAPELTRAFTATGQLAPNLRAVFERLPAIERASRRGLPAADAVLKAIPPLEAAFMPFLENGDPIVRYVGLFKQEVTGFFANVAAAAEGYGTAAPRAEGQILHYLRASQTLAPAGLTLGGGALGSTRNDAYRTPGAYDELAKGLTVLDSASCAGVNPSPPSTGDSTLDALVQQYVFRSTSSSVAAPACRQSSLIPGFDTQFPHLTADPAPAR
ncbi:MAG TPA: MlaD family protein [Solirubrobacteraceae bacterium]|nr:MlaD family protein [Solirubrobacteraceae bacterium]